MNKKDHAMSFKEWFVGERARALTVVLLTRRSDLVVTEAKEDSGLDFTVAVHAEGAQGNRPFGVRVAATMSPVTIEVANHQLEPTLAQVRSRGPFLFPVCVFYFTVKNDQGYYTWGYEPRITCNGPKLTPHSAADCRPLNDEAVEAIVSTVNQWYDAFYQTITA